MPQDHFERKQIIKKKISIKEFMEKLKIEINDLKIRIFHFNFIQVNTYVLYDDTKEAVIIDPGNYVEKESQQLKDFIDSECLTVKYIVNTHPHIDHIFGNDYCRNHFSALLLQHKAGEVVYENANEYLVSFKIAPFVFPPADRYVEADDVISYGHQQLKVLYTPGHCDGSISLYDAKNKLVFTGDVLFEESIGRTDLPTGNQKLLLQSIHDHLLTLDDDVAVYSGHGDATTIGKEKLSNPYL
jgi:glyoxylase-like metal-dependent hydrolase (beta-lactamase superfamily II)